MNTFSPSSLAKLDNIDIRLRVLAYKVLEIHDTKILCGLRTPEEQQVLFNEGKSKTLKSKHLEGKAIDMVPYPIDWDDIPRFYYFAGMVIALAHTLDIPIRWGGAWSGELNKKGQFMDLPHFELKNDA